MQNINKFTVLDGCRLALKYTNLYNKKDLQIFGRRIPNFLIHTFILIPMIYTNFLQMWFCIDEKFNLKSISSTLGNLMSLTHMSLIYVSLAVKSNLIIETLDNLQDLVDKSNNILGFEYFK